MQIKRGQIYLADLNPGVGRVQGSAIPVIVIQNDYGNRYAPTTIVAPITNRANRPKLPTRVNLPGMLQGSQMSVLTILDQPRTLDKSRLIKCVGAVDERTMAQIDVALAVSFGLEHS